MTHDRHPIDGDVIATDQHYERQDEQNEGMDKDETKQSRRGKYGVRWRGEE